MYKDTIITHTNNGTFFHKIKTKTEEKPKNICIEEENKNNCEFIIDQQTNEKHRIFGYYKDVDDYLIDNKFNNTHSYEILNKECKLYFDIEYQNNDAYFFDEIISSISKHYKAFFKQQLNQDDLCISTASGIGECSSWKGKEKHSYHIVVNNGLFFKKNQDIKYFIKYIYDNEQQEDVKKAIDKCVYGKNQSFKFPYQSKYGSDRIQKTVNGKFRQHLINKYSFCEFKGYYNFKIDELKQDKKTTQFFLQMFGILKMMLYLQKV